MVAEHRSDGSIDKWHDTITDAPKQVTNTTVNEFDVQKTGSSSLVQIPEHVLSNSVPTPGVSGNVLSCGGDKRGRAFLQQVKMTGSMSGSMMDGIEASARAGSLHGASAMTASTRRPINTFLSFEVDNCTLAFLRDAKATGSMNDGHEILARAGSLLGISFDGSDLKRDTSSSSGHLVFAVWQDQRRRASRIVASMRSCR